MRFHIQKSCRTYKGYKDPVKHVWDVEISLIQRYLQTHMKTCLFHDDFYEVYFQQGRC